VVKVVPSPEQTQHLQFRRTLVGPGINQPKSYPGYEGFVGWSGVARTKSGALLVTFSSGYWHASAPTGPTPLPADFAELFKKLSGVDLSSINAPRGGRAECMRSQDGGLTWSRPQVMIDTPLDDRSPSPVQLSDGTLVASFFDYDGRGSCRTGVIRSFDEGKTWEQTPRFLTTPFVWTATDGPPLEMPDKSLLLAVYGGTGKVKNEVSQFGVFESRDRGDTWRCIGTNKAAYNLDEPSIALLRDGRLIMIARPEGAVSWSSDGGHTWAEPVRLPFRMFDPWLLSLKDGTLLCVHGSYHKDKHGLRAILSPDGGKTWFAAGPDYGFSVDPSVYGYSRGIQLPDGSIYIVYLHTGGHKWDDARNESLFALRFRVLKGCRGIELLPAPGSPGAGRKDPGAASGEAGKPRKEIGGAIMTRGVNQISLPDARPVKDVAPPSGTDLHLE
jgi:hypothetical protein